MGNIFEQANELVKDDMENILNSGVIGSVKAIGYELMVDELNSYFEYCMAPEAGKISHAFGNMGLEILNKYKKVIDEI